MLKTLRLAVAGCVAAGLSCAQDPAATQRAALMAAIEKHPFFKKVDFTIEEHGDLLFLVQRPQQDDPMYVRKVVNHYLPFLLELARVFEREYAVPAGLERREDVGFYAIAILASRGNYGDYAQAVRDRGLHGTRAHYDSRLKLAVTYEDLFGGGGGERGAILHEFMHALQHAHSRTGEMPNAIWFNEGLADYRSSSTHVASSLKNPKPLDEHVLFLASILGDARQRAMAFPLRDLLSVQSYEEVVKNAQGRMPQLSDLSAFNVFYAQSDLFVDFLHSHESGKYLPMFRSWMKQLLEGKGSMESLQAAAQAAATDFATLEHEWLGYLTDVMRRRFRNFPELRPLARGSGATEASAPVALTPFDPQALALTEKEAGERTAAAQNLCARGRFDEALELLAPATGERAVRERERVEAVVALRDEVLRAYIERGGDLEIELPEGIVDARPIAWDGKVLRVEVDDRETEPPLHCVIPQTLLRPGWRLHLFEGDKAWLDAYLRWLNGRPLDKRPMPGLLRKSDAGTVALAADLDGDFDPGRGALALWLWGQRGVTLPEDPAAARDALDRLRELLEQNRGHPLVTARREPLTTYARALAERAFSMEDAAYLGLHGKPGEADDGRIRVTYDGLQHDLTKDFSPEVDWDNEEIPVPRLAFQGPPQIRTRGQRFELIGSGMLNWRLPMKAPITVEVELEFTGENYVMVGVCCEQEQGVILCSVSGEVFIADAESQIVDNVGQAEGLYAEEKYRLRLEHDGKSLKVSRDGQQTAHLTRVGGRTQGAVSLMVHGSNPVVIHSLTIEGVADKSRSGELRAAFVEGVLEALWK